MLRTAFSTSSMLSSIPIACSLSLRSSARMAARYSSVVCGSRDEGAEFAIPEFSVVCGSATVERGGGGVETSAYSLAVSGEREAA